jgi:hypothetical protein
MSRNCDAPATCGRPATGDTRPISATPKDCTTLQTYSPTPGPICPLSPLLGARSPTACTRGERSLSSTAPRFSRTGGVWPSWTTNSLPPKPTPTWPVSKVPATNANRSWSSYAAPHDPTAHLGCWPTLPPNAPAKPSPPVSATPSVASPTLIQNSVPISTAQSVPALPADTNQAHATSCPGPLTAPARSPRRPPRRRLRPDAALVIPKS